MIYVTIGNGKPVFSTDIDDVAWDYSQELKDEYDNVYIEEIDMSEFNALGKYETTEGDVITLDEIIEAEQHYRNEDLRPKKAGAAKNTGKKKRRKSYRQYLDGQISTMYPNGVKRLLKKLGVEFNDNAEESDLGNLLLVELNKYKKNKDDHAEALFIEVNDCANVPLRIMQLANYRTYDETREVVISLLDRLNASYDSESELYILKQLLFDYVAAEADSKGQPIMDTFEEIESTIL